jgi:hypothetical protein
MCSVVVVSTFFASVFVLVVLPLFALVVGCLADVVVFFVLTIVKYKTSRFGAISIHIQVRSNPPVKLKK